MAKRLWGSFSIPGEREVGAGQQGSAVRWFLVGKMATKDVRGGERGAAICHGLLSSVKNWAYRYLFHTYPEKWIGINMM